MADNASLKRAFEDERQRMTEPIEKICRHCGKVLTTYQGLKDHENRHEGRAPYLCCGIKFFSVTHIRRHRCNKHGSDKLFTCDECGGKYATSTCLERHKETHSEKRFKCDVCGACIKREENLRDHLDKHTNEKQYRCKCGKSYRYRSSLSRHKKTCAK